MAEEQVRGLLLAEPAVVRQLAADNPEFGAYFTQALLDSGLRVTEAEAADATYRVTLAKGVVHYDLHYLSRLGNADASPTLAELVEPMLSCPIESLIHAIWACKSLAELQTLLAELRALTKFTRGRHGGLEGLVLMSSHINMLLELLARGKRVMSNGESMLDAVTRNLGVRAKARSLVEHTGNTEENELTDTGLARTLVQNWKR